MALLAWAQEVPGSNPGAPTKILRRFKRLSEPRFSQTSPLENERPGGYVMRVVRYQELRSR